MLGLQDKVALVTGASRGLGRGIAYSLAEQGAHVVVNYYNDKVAAEEVVEHIRSLGVRAIAVQANVSVHEDVKRLFEIIYHVFDRLDILVNNAGTNCAQTIFETTEEDWDRVLDVNLKSCFLCSKAAMEVMKEQRGGRIVNISSVVGRQGSLHDQVHYASTKSGMFGITKTLARTGAPYGINVNAVAPGVIKTDLLLEMLGDSQTHELEQSIPLGLGTLEDVGLAVAFLCGRGGRYITGATVDVNGGLYMG